MEQVRILIVEDEAAIVRMLEPTLAASGATSDVAWSGSQAKEYLEKADYDLVLCDLGLPDLDGQDLIRLIRERSDVPIIVLSARGMEQERIKALDSGADDFVPKPFAYAELRARIHALLRRSEGRRRSGRLRVGPLEIDPMTRDVRVSGRKVVLTQTEFALLRVLAGSPTTVHTKADLLRTVWGYRSQSSTRTLDSHACRLRQKLGADGTRFVINVWGVGYRLIDDPGMDLA